jgi:hypothetical protein
MTIARISYKQLWIAIFHLKYISRYEKAVDQLIQVYQDDY